MTDNDLLELYTDISRQHTAYVEQRVNALGLHSGQAAVITALGNHGSCTQTKLALLRHVSAATISVMVSRMEREGLVAREWVDKRFNYVSLTEKGRQLYEVLAADRIGETERIFAGLSVMDRKNIERAFCIMSTNLQQMTDGV